MKKYLILFVSLALLGSCLEDGPFIDFTPAKVKLPGDTDFVAATVATPQPHNVLIDDLTGVRCPNCPASHDAAKNISDAHPGRIVILGLHAYKYDIFTNPLGGIYPDFRDSVSDYIAGQLLGNPSQLPEGGVNRKLFPGEANRWLDYGKWSGYADAELALPNPVNISISNLYDANTRELTTAVRMEFTSDFTDDAYLSVGITENGIIGKQKDATTVIDDYVHNHVLREMLTPYAGMKINSPTIILTKQKVVQRVFKFTLPDDWDPSNCNVTAIVHKNSSLIDVIHCTEKKVL